MITTKKHHIQLLFREQKATPQPPKINTNSILFNQMFHQWPLGVTKRALGGWSNATAPLSELEYFLYITCSLFLLAAPWNPTKCFAQSLWFTCNNNNNNTITWRLIINHTQQTHTIFSIHVHQLRLCEASVQFEGLIPTRAFLQRASSGIDCRGGNHWWAVHYWGVVMHYAKFCQKIYQIFHLHQVSCSYITQFSISKPRKGSSIHSFIVTHLVIGVLRRLDEPSEENIGSRQSHGPFQLPKYPFLHH